MPKFAKILIAILALGLLGQWYASPHRIRSKVPHQLAYREWVFGGPAKGPLPMLIWLHGSGGDENDWTDVLARSPMPVRVISFRGPASQMSGYDWAPSTRAATQEEANALYFDHLQKAGQSVAHSVAELTRKYPTLGKPFLAGFSSGANLSYLIAIEHSSYFSAIFPIGGNLPAAMPRMPAEANASKTPVHAFHGLEDQVISFGAGQAAIDALKERGRNASMTSHPQGHRVYPEMVAVLYKHVFTRPVP